MNKSLPFIFLVFFGCHTFDYTFTKEKISKVENIFYIEDQNPKHRLDLFLPTNREKIPLVLFIHGGFWRNQDKTYLRPFTGLYHNVGIALSKRGIACAVINYRLFPETKLNGQLKDIESAIEWVEKNVEKFRFDRIYLMGHSAGGHLALLIDLKKQNRVKGIIALSPILDIANMKKNKDDEFNRELTIPLFGTDESEYLNSSPLTRINKSSTNTLYAFGENDYPFLLEQHKLLIEKKKAEKINVDVKIIPSHSHADMVLRVNSSEDEITPMVENFILGSKK